MYEICSIGHITNDKVVNKESVVYMPGGTAWYFSQALSRMPLKYLLVTALGEAELHYAEELRKAGVTVEVQPSEHTVFFENIYGDNKDERTQNVLAKADPFKADHLAATDAAIFHLGPLLADDISLDLIKTLSWKSKVSLDVQGYLRRVENQKVYAHEWAAYEDALPHIHTLKADVGEVLALTGQKELMDGVRHIASLGVKEVVVTNASKGSFIYADDYRIDIPAYMPHVVVDTTGCGDTYIAGYLFARSQGRTIEEAGHFGAAMAGLKTKHAGAFNGTVDEVEEFMRERV
ncbi:sugar/nucleoside kinase (ribokinase family) [Mucilaginibacter yixingensis]|uniref:Sugar/nucleoside kinase (Ribokinase family) n=1 Tax=Mucilaginibacter yixingensis TaxID=1295612 RepID=A0A2T5JDD0_9SPHI|nr:PfkB family carbohydrate kinase [Mucilaginibacter yixingensis]PTQ99764.1 sugar/nucleoside kinase (ribokinase family) [Mucilaginibacter yixingensis]